MQLGITQNHEKDQFSLSNMRSGCMLSKARQNSLMHTKLSSAGCHYRKYFTHVSTWWVWNHKQQRQNISTNSTLFHWFWSQSFFKDRVVCLVPTSRLQMSGHWCVFIFSANIKEIQLFRKICLENKHPKKTKQGPPAEWRHVQASTACVYQHRPVPPITPHTVESLRKLLSTFWWL